jgi:hypothetical protein
LWLLISLKHANVIKIYEHSMRSKFYYHIEHPAPIPTENFVIPVSESEAASPSFLGIPEFVAGIGAG